MSGLAHCSHLTCFHLYIPVPDFSREDLWTRERLAEYIPTITYEAESPDEAALVEVRPPHKRAFSLDSVLQTQLIFVESFITHYIMVSLYMYM